MTSMVWMVFYSLIRVANAVGDFDTVGDYNSDGEFNDIGDINSVGDFNVFDDLTAAGDFNYVGDSAVGDFNGSPKLERVEETEYMEPSKYIRVKYFFFIFHYNIFFEIKPTFSFLSIIWFLEQSSLAELTE